MAMLTCLLTRPPGCGRALGGKTRRAPRQRQAGRAGRSPRDAKSARRWGRAGTGDELIICGSGLVLATAVIPLVDRVAVARADRAHADRATVLVPSPPHLLPSHTSRYPPATA